MKKILIAIPTAKNIEAQTFISIYNLKIPEGYDADFQCFYGYSIDQVRNLIASYALKNNYDYLFCIDSDINLNNPEILEILLNHDKDIVGGVYRQRNLDKIIPEVFFSTPNGGCRNATIEEINICNGLIPVDSIGFGCVLIKKEVLEKIPYPHFYYQHSIDFKDTVSEDVYFCRKARFHGFETYCDTTIRPGHIGSFEINM